MGKLDNNIVIGALMVFLAAALGALANPKQRPWGLGYLAMALLLFFCVSLPGNDKIVVGVGGCLAMALLLLFCAIRRTLEIRPQAVAKDGSSKLALSWLYRYWPLLALVILPGANTARPKVCAENEELSTPWEVPCDPAAQKFSIESVFQKGIDDVLSSYDNQDIDVARCNTVRYHCMWMHVGPCGITERANGCTLIAHGHANGLVMKGFDPQSPACRLRPGDLIDADCVIARLAPKEATLDFCKMTPLPTPVSTPTYTPSATPTNTPTATPERSH